MPEKINSESKLLPEYENPPLTEVICGVTFKPLDNFISAHFGLLWTKYQPDFPTINEVPPLASLVELFEEQALEVEMRLTDAPPLPREMFVSRDENNIIQVQRERFIFNWRKARFEDSYPRYTSVIQSFQEKFAVFEEFIGAVEMDIKPQQYELTYINQIAQEELWENASDIGKIFPNLNLQFGNHLVLEEPERVNCRISFILPDKLGRLYATIQTGAVRGSEKKPVIVFDLTVRGMTNQYLPNMKDWFDLAHEWIVKGFTDLTSKKMQNEVWRRLQ